MLREDFEEKVFRRIDSKMCNLSRRLAYGKNTQNVLALLLAEQCLFCQERNCFAKTMVGNGGRIQYYLYLRR